MDGIRRSVRIRGMHALEQLLRQFDRDGFVTIDGALSPTEVRRLARLTERMRRSQPAAADGSLRPRVRRFEPAFVELVDHPLVLELVCAILGWNIHMPRCHLDVHPPAAGPNGHWRWRPDGHGQILEVETDPRPRLWVKVR